jgi:hypothetical protein
MNERIKELAVQAADACPKGYIELNEFIIPYTEKLAKLIVLACADRAFDLAPSDESACEISAAIKEHFGVRG